MTTVAIHADNSGTGTFTLSAPASNEDRTFNLPDESGTIALRDHIVTFKNKVINGKMEIAQRGVGPTNINSANGQYYLVDRFHTAIYGSGAVLAVSRQSDVPAGTDFQYSFRVAVSAADASVAAGDLAYISHRIEGYNIYELLGQPFTLSFYVRSSKTGKHCVTFGNNSDRMYVTSYTIDAANTWEYKTVTVPGGLPSAGTWNFTNGTGLEILWALMAGTTYHAASEDQWLASGYASSGQVNCLDTAGNIFAITGVQLEAGEFATPFEHRPYGLEYDMCRRYFRSFTSDAASFTLPIITGHPNRVQRPSYLFEGMRSSPTITYLTSGLAAGSLTEFSSGTNFSVSDGTSFIQASGSLTSDLIFRATANAEL